MLIKAQKIFTKNLAGLLVISLALLGFLFSSPFSPSTQAAESSKAACEALAKAEGRASSTCAEGSGITVDGTVQMLLNLLSWVAGIIAVVMVMAAGLKYITSQGDSQKVAGAKNALIFAAVGIVIAVTAQIIVRFVLKTTIDAV